MFCLYFLFIYIYIYRSICILKYIYIYIHISIFIYEYWYRYVYLCLYIKISRFENTYAIHTYVWGFMTLLASPSEAPPCRQANNAHYLADCTPAHRVRLQLVDRLEGLSATNEITEASDPMTRPHCLQWGTRESLIRGGRRLLNSTGQRTVFQGWLHNKKNGILSVLKKHPNTTYGSCTEAAHIAETL